MTLPLPSFLTRRRVIGAAASTLALPGIATAQSPWPDRPITLIVPFGAGGGNDITARTLGQFLERELGQPFVVQNRSGAGGEIGINAVADSRPDGHTFGILNTPGLVTIPIERNPRWNLNSFSFVASLVDDPAVIGVHAQSGITSLTDLVDAARREPEAVTIATQARGSTSFLSVRMLEMAAGISLTPVIYNALPPGVLAVAQREVRGAAANLGEALVMTASQPFRMLGVMAENRSSLDPSLATFREQGVDVSMGSLRGFVGPRGIPAPVLTRMTAAIDKVSKDAEYQDVCRRTQQPLRIMLGDAYVAHLRDADDRFRAMWRQKPWI